LWITKEILSSNDSNSSNSSTEEKEENQNDDAALDYESANQQPRERHGHAAPATELETLHSIPLKRRLRSCRYQNFYGDHRIVLELKSYNNNNTHQTRSFHTKQIVLRCPSAIFAKSWIDCLVKHKTKKKNASDAAHANIELEMVESPLSALPSMSAEGDDDDDVAINQEEKNGTGETGRTSARRGLHSRTRIVNVIDSEDGEDDVSVGFERNDGSTKKQTIAEQLQEAEDRKRAKQLADREAEQEELEKRLELEKVQLEVEEQQKENEHERERQQQTLTALELAEHERVAALEERTKLQVEERKTEEKQQHQQPAAIEKGAEKIEQPETQKLEENKREQVVGTTSTIARDDTQKQKAPLTAAEKQQLRMEREVAARQRAEGERRRIEIEYERAKKERAERRRKGLEAQRKKAREEQRKKELLQKKKFLESEQRKEAMKAAAMKPTPKKASVGVFSYVSGAGTTSTNTSAKTINITTSDSSKPTNVDAVGPNDKKEEKGNLWYSLGQQMSAFEAADEERKRKEEEQRKEEEKEEGEEEHPDEVRKRIAEEARQRLVQDEAEKLAKENSSLKGNEEAAKLAAFRQQQELQRKAWAAGQQQQQQTAPSPLGSTSPTNEHHSRSQSSLSPTSSHAHPNQHHVQQQQQQQQPNLTSTSTPIPPYPTSHHAHTQSWNQMQNPSYPPQHAQFQHQQSGVPAGISHPPTGPTTPGYQQQPNATQSNPANQQRAGSYGKTLPSHQHHTMQHPHQQKQMNNAQEPPAPRPTQHQSQPPQQPPQSQPSNTAQPPQQQSNGESNESALKRNVLLKWGLQPPAMQILRPVDQLLCSIHIVFPPSFGMPHDYFQSWKPITTLDVMSANGSIEETKLKKMVRKIRFFLHPDKLPHDLTEDQQFLCKLLWDVINDAFEEYKKSKEALDWM